MTKNEIALVVEEVLRRLRKKVLVVLTAENGYEQQVREKLSHYPYETLYIVMASQAKHVHSEDVWRKLGTVLNINDPCLAKIEIFDHIFLPFLDFNTVAKIAHGIMDDEVTTFMAQALMKNRSVVAFDYNCNPASELNEVKGLNLNPAYTHLVQSNIQTLLSLGVNIVTISKLDVVLHGEKNGNKANLEQGCAEKADVVKAISGEPIQRPRYMTFSEIEDQNAVILPKGRVLTDLALEYVKQKHIQVIKQ